MVQIHRILCPLDFSDESRHAFDHAVMLAGWYRSTLTVLHVRHPAFYAEPPILFAEIAGSEPSLEDAQARMQSWLAPARSAGVECDAVALDGNNPAARIVETAGKIGADLIVLGTHGRSGFQRLLLGSVTEKVVRTATCPVVTVPPPSVATSVLPFTRIVCGVDFSDSSTKAVRFALSIAKESGARLTLLHAFELPDNETLAMFDLATYRDAVRADAQERLAALITDEDRVWCEPSIRVVLGKPYEQVLAAVAEEHADLVVLGVHGRNPFDIMVFGSTTNQVVRRATCPVLTLRA